MSQFDPTETLAANLDCVILLEIAGSRFVTRAKAVTHRCGLSDDLDDTHHAFVFVVDRVAVVDKPTDDHGIGKWDDYFECGRALGCCWRYRKSIAKTVVVPRNAAHFRDQEGRLVDVEAMVLLVRINDGPLLGFAELDCLVDASSRR